MLILTRRIGETVVIGDKSEITVTILGINNHQIKLGFTANQDIKIHRSEVYQKIQQAHMSE